MSAMSAADAKRLLGKVVAGSNNCWQWTGTSSGNGYGIMRVSKKNYYVHRLAYEHFVGPIPEGLVLDHLCRNTFCLNPDHLEAVTHAENCRRGLGGWNMLVKTHCPQGHPYDGDNLYRWRNTRQCKKCIIEAQRRKRARRRERERRAA